MPLTTSSTFAQKSPGVANNVIIPHFTHSHFSSPKHFNFFLLTTNSKIPIIQYPIFRDTNTLVVETLLVTLTKHASLAAKKANTVLPLLLEVLQPPLFWQCTDLEIT
jgi:hypothetical protein